MMRGMATLESGHMRIAADAMVAATLLYVVQPSHVLDAFVYPPHAKMLLLPFGAMPSGAALAIWTALNLFCLLRARELLGSPPDLILIAAVSPLTVIMVATGYPVGFLALMMTIVLAQGHERPGPAGLCLALMTVHPQLAFGFALLLLPLGYVHAVSVAAGWTVALLGVSMITVGVEAWTDYLAVALPWVAEPPGTP